MRRLWRLAAPVLLGLFVGCGGCQERTPEQASGTARPTATSTPTRPARVARTTPVRAPGATPAPQRPRRPVETPDPRSEERVQPSEPPALPSEPPALPPSGQGPEEAGHVPGGDWPVGDEVEPQARPAAPTPRPATEEPDRYGDTSGRTVVGVTQPYDTGYQQGEEPSATEEEEPEPEDSDSEPPLILSVTFNPPEIQDGTTVQVLIETEDNLSGAVSAAGSVESPSRQSFLSFAAGPHPDHPGLLVGNLRVPASAEDGPWAISFLRVMDAAQNAQALTAARDSLLANAGFNVISETPDTILPVVHSITVEPREVEEGEQFKVFVRVTDEGSGIKVVRGVISSPGRAVRVNFFPRLHGGEPRHQAAVSLPPFPEAGEWRVTLLTVHDKAGGRTIIGSGSELLADAKVLVYSTREDTEPPSMNSIELTPRFVRREDEVQILVDAWDDQSGIGSVDGWLRNRSHTGRVHFTLHSKGSPTLYEGTVKLHRDASVGQWHVERLQVSDRAGNRRVYTWEKDPELADATFDSF